MGETFGTKITRKYFTMRFPNQTLENLSSTGNHIAAKISQISFLIYDLQSKYTTADPEVQLSP